jgi:hypothetical protein
MVPMESRRRTLDSWIGVLVYPYSMFEDGIARFAVGEMLNLDLAMSRRSLTFRFYWS